MKKLTYAVGLFALLLFSSKTQATLIDRGNGLIFDSTNNISWTKDASLSGPANNWDGQNTFAANLTLAGFDDFRLASIDELSSLYGQLSTLDGCFLNCTGNQDPFTSIQPFYWSGTEYDPYIAWGFDFFFVNGAELMAFKDSSGYYGWAVRPGDSVGVPEPGAWLLMGVGLLGIGLAQRQRFSGGSR